MDPEGKKQQMRASFIYQNRKAIKLQQELKKEHKELYKKELEKKVGRKLKEHEKIEMTKEAQARQQLQLKRILRNQITEAQEARKLHLQQNKLQASEGRFLSRVKKATWKRAPTERQEHEMKESNIELLKRKQKVEAQIRKRQVERNLDSETLEMLALAEKVGFLDSNKFTAM